MSYLLTPRTVGVIAYDLDGQARWQIDRAVPGGVTHALQTFNALQHAFSRPSCMLLRSNIRRPSELSFGVALSKLF